MFPLKVTYRPIVDKFLWLFNNLFFERNRFKSLYWICYNIAFVLHFGVCVLFCFSRPGGMWELSSLTRNWTTTSCLERQSLNHQKWKSLLNSCSNFSDFWDKLGVKICQGRVWAQFCPKQPLTSPISLLVKWRVIKLGICKVQSCFIFVYLFIYYFF